MASPNWQKIQELFQKCVDKSTEQQREILQNECGDDVELIREVQKLLAGDNSAKSQFLEWPDGRSESSGDGDESEPTLEHDSRQDEVSESGFPATKTAVSPNSGQLRQIGPYKLLEEIGHGGMGEVWLAQQTEPVSRRVAIKLIKSQLTGRMEVARFEAERQALALMDHPNIAKVFDAGTTEDGLPYYVMEFINGISVTEYCDEHQLSIRDRLQVFIPICRAIQHAHQKGIIHRDLKPSNILVGESEGFPIPKVIDFGLAKATDHQRLLTDKTLFTEIGKVVGTLQYMSPEQAALNSNDIDSRTDVYSLGIVLYELLTGLTPLDRQTIKDKAILKVLEIIRQSDTPRPSFRLSSSGETITTVSAQRQIEPKKLQSILRGELDWVVMKALEKDRNRRYDTASSFADDIHRFLINEPVAARPPSRSYKIGKFIERNRLLVVSSAAIALLAIIGVSSLIFAYQESLKKADYANKLVKAEAASLTSLNELTDSVKQDMSGFNIAETLVKTDPIQDPIIKSRHESAALLSRLGFYLREFGAKPSECNKWFLNAVKKYEELEVSGELQDRALLSYATTLNNASLAARDDGNQSAAIAHSRKEIELLETLIKLNLYDNDLVRKQIAMSYLNLGIMTKLVDDDSQAIRYLLQMNERDAASETLLAKCYSNRAGLRKNREDAETDMLRAIELFDRYDRKQQLMQAYDYMAIVQGQLGKSEQEQNYRSKAVALAKESKGEISASQAELISSAERFYNAALALHQKNDVNGALENYNEAIDALNKVQGENSAIETSLVYFQSYWNRAEAFIELGQLELAESDLIKAIAAAKKSGNKKFLSYLPYLEARVLRCEAEQDPVMAASSLEYVTRDIANKGETLIILASVYSLAAKAEKDESKRQRWVDKAIEAIDAIKQSGKLAPQFVLELNTGEDFEFLREFPEFAKVIKNE